MAEPWILLVIGGTLLLVGFAASLLFERFRIPDFFVLMLLGFGLAMIPFAPFGPAAAASLAPIVPLLMHLTLAFILFEGGLALNARGGGRRGILAVHILGAMALTMAATYLLATQFLGLSPITALALAAAFSGPSATIVLSFAPRLHLSPEALKAIVLEGVLGNVAAAVIVLFAIQFPGAAPTVPALVDYFVDTALAGGLAAIVGLAWRAGLASMLPYKFQSIATVGLAVVVYGVAEGLIGQNGAIAAFVLGLVIGRGHPELSKLDDATGEGLRAFQSEITFGLRTFFFVYLGLSIQIASITLQAVLGALLLAFGFLVARVPTSFLLGRANRLTRRDTRVVSVTIGRGLTDLVLILFAIASGVVPAGEAPFLVSLLPLIILFAATICAILVAWAARTPETKPADRRGALEA